MTDLTAVESPAERRTRKAREHMAAKRAEQTIINVAHARAWVTAYAEAMVPGDEIAPSALWVIARAELAHLPTAEMPTNFMVWREAAKVLGPQVRRSHKPAVYIKRAPGAPIPAPKPRSTVTASVPAFRPAPVPTPAPIRVSTPARVEQQRQATPDQLTEWLEARARAMVPGVQYDAAELAHSAAAHFAPQHVARNAFYKLADATLGPRHRARNSGYFPFYTAPTT